MFKSFHIVLGCIIFHYMEVTRFRRYYLIIGPLWHIVYFKQKESEKQHVQEGFYDLPLKQIIKLSLRGTLSTQEGETLISKDRWMLQGI